MLEHAIEACAPLTPGLTNRVIIRLTADCPLGGPRRTPGPQAAGEPGEEDRGAKELPVYLLRV